MRFFFLFLALPFTVFSLYNGNPSLPMMPELGVFTSKEACFGAKIGYECDGVYGCHLKTRSRHLPQSKNQNFKSLAQFGVATLNFNDRVELFGDMGSLSCHWTQSLHSQDHVYYKAKPSWCWAIGGRALLAYWGHLQLSVNAAYERTQPSLSCLKMNEQSYCPKKAHMDLTAWQIGSGVSYRFGWFLPYIGIDYMNFLVEAKRLSSLRQFISKQRAIFRSENPFGLFLGLGLGPDVGFNLNLEARFFTENGCSASADFKF